MRLYVVLALAACSDGGFVKYNATPTATITSHGDGDSISGASPLRLRGVVGDPNDAQDTLRATWLVDGVAVCGDLTPENDGVTTCSATATEPAVEVVLEVRDPDGAAARESVSLWVQQDGADDGAAPTVSTVSIGPSPATTVDVLAAEATWSDADGDALNVQWEWFVDGLLVASGAEPTLDGGAPGTFDKHQSVYAVVTVDDGAHSVTGTSPTVEIVNTAPTTPSATIVPSFPRPGDALVCGVATAADDLDGDLLQYRVSWEVDGVAFGGGDPLAGPTTSVWPDDTVPGEWVDSGQTWTCWLTPNDSEDDGPAGIASVSVCSLGRTESCPGLDCLDILNSDSSAADGVYWLDPTGSLPFETYCDMTTDGGGWTLVMKAVLDNYNYNDDVWTTTVLDNETDLDLTLAGTAKYESFNTVPFTELRSSDPTVWTTEVVHTFAVPQTSALAVFSATGFVLDTTANPYFNARAVPFYQSWGCTQLDRYGVNLYDALGCRYEYVSSLCDHNGGARFGNRVNRYGCSSCGDLNGQGWAPYSCGSSANPSLDTGPSPVEAGHTIDELMWVR